MWAAPRKRKPELSDSQEPSGVQLLFLFFLRNILLGFPGIFVFLREMSLNNVVLWWNSQAEANDKSPRQ